jgi:hypothetical protein
MPPVAILAYVLVCLLVGWLGRDRQIGFSGVFVMSLVITPVVMCLVLLIGAPKEK